MCDEQLIRWEPISQSEGKYYTYRICECIDGLEIIVVHEDIPSKKVSLLFDKPVYAYTSTNETLASHTLNELEDRYGIDFYGDWTFFMIKNSQYIKRLSQESRTLSDTYDLQHFVLITADSITDIISHYEPKSSWITYELPSADEDEDDA